MDEEEEEKNKEEEEEENQCLPLVQTPSLAV